MGVVGMCLLTACTDSQPSTPVVLAVSPDVVDTMMDTAAVLMGRNFVSGIHVGVDDHSPPRLNQAWAVHVDGQRLPKVRWVDTETLALVLPAGLALGSHDITVVSPAN